MRKYRQGDFEALYAIDRQCFDAGIAYSRGELQSYIERKQSFCIVAEAAAQAAAGEQSRPSIAGFILVEVHHQGYGHIITIDVLSQHRRRHLGTMLLEAAEEQVRKVGGFMMVLETAVNNRAALAFYDKHRFKVLKKLPGYYGKRLDAWFLSKRL